MRRVEHQRERLLARRDDLERRLAVEIERGLHGRRRRASSPVGGIADVAKIEAGCPQAIRLPRPASFSHAGALAFTRFLPGFVLFVRRVDDKAIRDVDLADVADSPCRRR
jgi:hypothetical protein